MILYYDDDTEIGYMMRHHGIEVSFATMGMVVGCRNYVATKSYPIFEPRVGDLMLRPGNGGDPDIAIFVEDAADIADCTIIIQRNGRAFFMPKQDQPVESSE